MNELNIKRNIFNLYDNVRQLWNDYYNGHESKYTPEEIKEMLDLLSIVTSDIEEIKEELRWL